MPRQAQRRGDYYYVGDKKYVRVSKILEVLAKPALIPWAARQAAEILLAEPPERRYESTPEEIVTRVFGKRDTSANVGSEVHSILNAFAQGAKIDVKTLKPELQNYVQAGLTFFNTLHFKKILFTEVTCYSETYQYGGTIDCILELANNEIWLYDFKTGGIYKEATLQVAAYKHAALEMKLVERIDHTALVQLTKNGQFVVKTANEPIEAFLYAKGLYEWALRCSFY